MKGSPRPWGEDMSKSLHPLLRPDEGVTEALQRQDAEIERLRALVKDLADDLESELSGRYFIKGEIHPAEVQRFERDMANVYEARRALGEKT